MINILIVDDHSIVGEGTKTLLDGEQDFSVDFFGSSLETIELIKDKNYDVYLLDLNMPEINGIALTVEILNVYRDAKVLIFTGHDISCYYNYLIQSGVSGVLSKTSSKQQLIRAIRGVIDSQAVIPLELLHQLRKTEIKVCFEDGNEIILTQKEEGILLKIAEGTTNEQIAEELFLSKRSVERHLTNIFKKLEVSSRAEAIAKGRNLGLLPDVLI